MHSKFIVCKNSRHFVQAPCVHLFRFRIVNAWVGLIRLSGNYHWIDGTEYTNDDGSTNTRCMFVAVDLLLGVGVYDAEDCSKTKQFVCEDIPPPGMSTYSYRFLLKLVGVRGQCHDDDIKWKHFPRCWPFVRKPSWCRRFETPLCSLCCHCNDVPVVVLMVMAVVWTSYQIRRMWIAHAPGMPGTFSPTADFKGNR